MPLRNTELIPARSPILKELAGLGMTNALVLLNVRTVGKNEAACAADATREVVEQWLPKG
jgi:hypothetical protein